MGNQRYQQRNNTRQDPPKEKGVWTDKAIAAMEAIWADKSVQGSYARAKQKHIDFTAEKEAVRRQIGKNDFLGEAVTQNAASAMAAMQEIASLGLSLSPLLGHAFLMGERLNGKMVVNPSVGYRGLEMLAIRAKLVKHIQCELVYERDTFRRGMNENGENYVVYEMARGKDHGVLEGAFCRAMMTNGSIDVEYMTVEELDGCKAAATLFRKGTTPATWTGAFVGEMQKKCVVRRASKHWDVSGDFVRAIELIDRNEPMAFKGDDAPPAEESATIEPISQPHREEIMGLLKAKGVEQAKAESWMKAQTSAWGHPTLDHYPDGEWEKLRDVLLERVKKVEEARKAKGKEKANADA
jgi:phage RecT family recombinase